MALPPLSRALVQQYSRQLLLPWMSQAGQQALLASRVCVPLTADAACEWAVAYLAAAGVGHLVLRAQQVAVTGPLLAASERQALLGDVKEGARRYARLIARAVHDRNPDVLVSLEPTRPDGPQAAYHAAESCDLPPPLFFEIMTAAPGDAAAPSRHFSDERQRTAPTVHTSAAFGASPKAPPHLAGMWHAAVACCEWIARRCTTARPAPASQPPLLTAHQLQAMVAAATAAFPLEACGWLAGANVVCATNVAPQPAVSYLFSDTDQLNFAHAFSGSAPPVAIFHSHPHGQATLSEADITFAVAPPSSSEVPAPKAEPLYPVVHIVLAGAPRHWTVRAFAWSNDGHGPGYRCYDEVWCTL